MLEKPILHGETVTLRPIRAEDAEAMFASLADAESMRLTGTADSFTFEQVQAHCARLLGADDRADYAITLRGGPDTMLGEVVLNNIEWDNRSANFRIAIPSEHADKGLGTQAIRLILHYGFMTLNLHRVELEVYTFNPRALHVYEKVGFVREGVKRDVLLWEGEYHSAIVMSILKPEFEARLAALAS